LKLATLIWSFNFSFLRNNSQNRAALYGKNQNSSNRSSSAISLRASSTNNLNANSSNHNNGTLAASLSNYFMIKHDHSSKKRNSSKSNSAPSSPNMNSNKKSSSKNQDSKNAQKNATVSENKPKLRPSISSSSYMLDEAGTNNKKANVKKKLAFSDEDILNDEKKSASNQRQSLKDKSVKKVSGKKSESKESPVKKTQAEESKEDKKNKDKRSVSLTKPASGSVRSASSSQKGGANFDFKSIYEAFEKPIDDLSRTGPKESGNNYETHKPSIVKTDMKDYTAIQNLIYNKQGYNSLKYDSQAHKRQASANGRPMMENYIDREKIAAAAAAAEAAAAAIEKDKEFLSKSTNSLERNNYLTLSNSNNNSTTNEMFMNVVPSPTCSLNANQQQTRPITNFYSVIKSQLETLPVIV
jgi:hypothetical protein